MRNELWPTVRRHLESCRDYYWLHLDDDWRVVAASGGAWEEILRGEGEVARSFLETIATGLAEDIRECHHVLQVRFSLRFREGYKAFTGWRAVHIAASGF